MRMKILILKSTWQNSRGFYKRDEQYKDTFPPYTKDSWFKPLKKQKREKRVKRGQVACFTKEKKGL